MPIVLGVNSGAGSPSNEYQNGKPIFAGQLRYVPKYWDDLRIPANAMRGGGASDPPYVQYVDDGAGSIGVFAYLFPAVNDRDLFFWAQLPHSWAEGTSIRPHIHWTPTSAGAGDVLWVFEYTVATIGGAFPLTTIRTTLPSASGVDREHQIAFFPDIVMTSDMISAMLGCRICREGTSVTDTYPNQAALLEMDFHFQLNTPGSRQPFIK